MVSENNINLCRRLGYEPVLILVLVEDGLGVASGRRVLTRVAVS